MWCTGIAGTPRANASERPTVAPTSSAPTRPDLRYTPPHQSLLQSVPPLSARPGSAVRFYVRDRARPVLALRRRSQRVISPDYTIGWLKDLFIVVNGDAGFIAGCFNTQYTHDLFYLALLPRSVGPMRVDVNFVRPGVPLVYTPCPYKVPFKIASVLYKAAAIAVKFRTILK